MKHCMGSGRISGAGIVLLAGMLALAGLESAPGTVIGTTNHVWHSGGGSASYIRGTPAFGDDGSIYVGSGDNNLYAFNPDGTTNHVWATGGDIIGSPVIGSNGTIYIGSCDNKVWAFNPDGTTGFSWTLNSSTYGTPAIGADGTIYIGDLGHKFYALNPADGSTSHVWNVGGDFRGHAAIAADGTIYVGNDDHNLYAFNPDGTTNHVWAMSGQIYHGPTISSNGTIYIGDQAGYFWAFNADGTTQHVWKLSDMVYHSSAAIGPDGRIYVGAMSTIATSAYCFALNPDGTTNRAWRLSSRYSMNSPVIGADGTVFIASEYTLFGLNPVTGATNVTWYIGSDMMSSPTIGPDNQIYIGCENGSFYSLGGILPMANTCWPKAHQNLKNTGLVFYTPQNVSASAGAYYNRVAITWDSVPQATGYLVYRSLTNSAPLPLGSSTSNSYSDTTATAGTTYYYWLKATNAIFTSALGDYVTGSRAVYIAPPRAPVNVRASDGTYANKIRVSWSAVTNAYSYEVLRSLINATGTAASVGSTILTELNDSSAAINTVYYYWVYAINDGGVSRFSLSDIGIRAAIVAVPSAPQNLKASDGAYTNKVALTWTAVSNAAAYKVYRSTNDTTTAAAWICDATIPLTHDTLVTVGTVYYYWIRAINSAGLGAYSASDAGYAGAIVVAPAAPSGIAATKGAYTDRVRVSWSAVSNATAYEVYRNTADDSTSATKLEPDASSSPFDDATVTVGATYYYWVKAKNDGGSSGFSSSDSGYAVTTVVAPSAPTGVAATKGAYTDRVRVSWSVVSNAMAYEVYRSMANDSASAVKLEPDATSSPFDDSTVTVGATYYYWVKAKNDGGSSGFSSSDFGYAVTTVVAPSAPTGVAASKGAYTDCVRVSWAAVSNATVYEVSRNTANDSGLATKLAPDATSSPFDDTTAAVGTTYYYWVKAKNAAGNSGFSAGDYGIRASRFVPADFDGDGKADPAIHQAGTGWYIWFSGTDYARKGPYLATTNIGVAMPGDFDGDGKADPALYTEGAGWWINFSFRDYIQGGPYLPAAGSGIALVGDVDGDGKADPALYLPSNGWYIWFSGSGYALGGPYLIGVAGVTPVLADFDGDEKADPALYRASDGWYIWFSGSGYALGGPYLIGATGYTARAADFDGDGKADPALYQDTTGKLYLWLSANDYALFGPAGPYMVP